MYMDKFHLPYHYLPIEISLVTVMVMAATQESKKASPNNMQELQIHNWPLDQPGNIIQLYIGTHVGGKCNYCFESMW